MLHTRTMVRTAPSVRGVPPRFQVFDRRKKPPMTVCRFYRDPRRDAVVFEVYEDDLRELLKRSPAFQERRFFWMLDVDADAPGDTISTVVRPDPMPAPEPRGPADAPKLTLEEALRAFEGLDVYRVIRTSDPL